MHGREQENVAADLTALGILLVNLVMRAEEKDQVQKNERDGDDWPPTAFHAFVAKRQEHKSSLFAMRQETAILCRICEVQNAERLAGRTGETKELGYKARK